VARKDGIAIEATGAPAPSIQADVLALPVFEEETRGGGTGRVRELDGLLGGALVAALRAERFEGKVGQEHLYPPSLAALNQSQFGLGFFALGAHAVQLRLPGTLFGIGPEVGDGPRHLARSSRPVVAFPRETSLAQ
jgi:hypothetical protein